MVECWEKEKSVAMAMAVLRIWHTRPESKKANVGVDAQLCQFEPGTALKRFLSTKDFTYQYPSPPHTYIMKSRFWKFCFFPFQEVFFFLTFLTPDRKSVV